MQVDLTTVLIVNQKTHKMFRFVPGLERIYAHFTGQVGDKEHWKIASAMVLAWMELPAKARAEYMRKVSSMLPGEGEMLANGFLKSAEKPRKNAKVHIDPQLERAR